MSESTGDLQAFADLLETAATDFHSFDWDPSALADWPNIAPAQNSAFHPRPTAHSIS